ncbi:hypothetical protein [Thermobifida alba]|uniref:hypothetical protein n=1 Tax=Thermobifida alba TaxID=53522 RepID=UPI0020BF41D9|nr:hypothetical protein [Thermobifida alba]
MVEGQVRLDREGVEGLVEGLGGLFGAGGRGLAVGDGDGGERGGGVADLAQQSVLTEEQVGGVGQHGHGQGGDEDADGEFTRAPEDAAA